MYRHHKNLDVATPCFLHNVSLNVFDSMFILHVHFFVQKPYMFAHSVLYIRYFTLSYF